MKYGILDLIDESLSELSNDNFFPLDCMQSLQELK